MLLGLEREYASRPLQEVNQNLFKEDIAKSETEDSIAKKKRRREMLAEGLISEEEYRADIADLEARYKPQKKRVDLDWTKRANEIVDLAQEFVEVMEAKNQIQPKRKVLTRLGSNLVWDDEKLSIYFAKPRLFEFIKQKTHHLATVGFCR